MDRWVAAISSTDSMQAGSQTKAGSASSWQRCADGCLVLLSLEKCLQRDPKDTYNTTIDSRMLPFRTTRTSMAFAPRGEGVRPRPLRHSVMCKADLWVGRVVNPHRSQEQASPLRLHLLHAAPHRRGGCHDCITLPQCPSSL